MKKILPVLLIISFVLWLNSCKQADKGNSSVSDSNSNVSFGLASNQARIYSLPSPFQVSALFKIMDIKYNDELIKETKNSNSLYSSPVYKSMNLGVSLVDLYYTTAYEQYPTSSIYLEKVENLMYEVGLKSKIDYELINRIEKSFNIKDSLYSFIKLYEKDFEDYYNISQEKQITFLIVSGIYAEGLYFSTNMYNNSFRTKSLSFFMEKNFNSIILQQAIFLDNLVELLKSYNDPNLQGVIDKFSELQKQFDKMNIQYKTGESNELTDIQIKKSDISKLNDIARKIRNEIISEKI